MSNWGHESREVRFLDGDLEGGGVIGGKYWRSKQALEFGRLHFVVNTMCKKILVETMTGIDLLNSALRSSIKF